MVLRNDERNNYSNKDPTVEKIIKVQVNPVTVIKTQEGTDLKDIKRLPLINLVTISQRGYGQNLWQAQTYRSVKTSSLNEQVLAIPNQYQQPNRPTGLSVREVKVTRI